MKIYTKTGDKGQTSLVGGARVAKTHIRLDAYGTVDELNSYLGLCISSLELQMPQSRQPDEMNKIIESLKRIQHRLFNTGSLLACEDPKISEKLPSLDESDIKKIETEIDEANAHLAPLREFILPGGSISASHLHVARTLARRAERQIVKLSESASLHPEIVPFINRLSDYLFILSRRVNQLLEQPDIKWIKGP